MKKIGIFTWHDVTKAYSCFFYLKERLSEYAHVDIWARENISSDKEDGYYSFFNMVYGRIPKVRYWLSKIHIVLLAKRYDVIIINDLDFFVSGYVIKKLFPDKVVIHYNTEIHGKDVPYPKSTERFYVKHATFPDMVIECLKERAEYRSTKYLNNQPVYVINNTLPKNEISKIINKNEDVSRYFSFYNPNLPTVVYAGGIGATRSFSSLFKSILNTKDTANFLFFFYGDDTMIRELKSKYNNTSNCRIFDAVNRDTLFSIMSKCEIGIQYYDPAVSVNHYYASPSKFYEYIAVGLNVLSSNNHGIDRIIRENELGLCFDNEEELPQALNRLLSRGLKSRDYITDIFTKKLCYECDSESTINKIMEVCSITD